MRACLLVAAGVAAALTTAAAAAVADDLPADAVSHCKTLQQWIKDLHSNDAGVVETAMQNICNYGKNAEEAIGPVVWHLKNGRDVGVKANAAYTLAAIGVDAKHREAAANALSWRLRFDPAPPVRYQSAMALAHLGREAKEAVRDLVLALTDRETWEIRKAAASALGTTAATKDEPPDRSVIEALIRTGSGINDPVMAVRLECLHTLIRIGPPSDANVQASAVRALQSIVRDKNNAKNYPLVIWTHLALVRMDKLSDEHIKPVVDQLKNPDPTVRLEAALAMQVMATGSVVRIPELTEALGAADQPREVADAVAGALAQSKDKISSQQLQAIAALLKDQDPLVRCHGALGLAVLGTQAKFHTQDLINALKDSDPSVVKSAITALTVVADPPAPAIAALKQLAAESKEAPIQAMSILAADQLAHRANKLAQQGQAQKPTP